MARSCRPPSPCRRILHHDQEALAICAVLVADHPRGSYEVLIERDNHGVLATVRTLEQDRLVRHVLGEAPAVGVTLDHLDEMPRLAPNGPISCSLPDGHFEAAVVQN